MIVLKFGGSSLGSANKIQSCIGIIGSQLKRRPVVVVSAMGNTTNMLIQAAHHAKGGQVKTEAVRSDTLSLCKELGIPSAIVEPFIDKLEILLHGVSLVGELTARTLDHIMSFGERISVRVLAEAMERHDIPAVALNAYEIGFLTDSRFGSAAPLPDIEDKMAENLRGYSEVPVLTGFLGRDVEGSITTIGRSGSDYTAAIIGSALNAEEIQIWTDVDGVMTADPSVEPEARNIPALSFLEASELAYYGAEVIHPGTIIPAVRKNIPVLVGNAMNPERPGTVIRPETVLNNDRIAKSIVYKENLCLLTIVSPKLMAGSLLAASLSVLDAQGVGIHVAATSEASVSLVTDRSPEGDWLKKTLAELRQLGSVSIERNKALICVVGEELRGRPMVLGKIFTTLGQTGIKARLVSQSASELNIAFLVDDQEISTVVTTLHHLLRSP